MTEVTNKERRSCPVLSLLRGSEISPAQKAGIYIGLVLTACAIGVFIWLIVQAAHEHSSRGIVMASSFILFAIGLLYFFLARINNPRRAWIFLYISIPLAVAAFVVSLYLDGGAQAPNVEQQRAAQIENVYDATEGGGVQNDGNLE